MVKVVLFDLGNTLISYYTRDEFPWVLENAIENCITYLQSQEIGINKLRYPQLLGILQSLWRGSDRSGGPFQT
jgi:FMN phosphatase YigB (HAD superfamily)